MGGDTGCASSSRRDGGGHDDISHPWVFAYVTSYRPFEDIKVFSLCNVASGMTPRHFHNRNHCKCVIWVV